MQFRWIAAITLWTCLSGPVFSGLFASSAHTAAPAPRAAHK